MKFKPSSDLCFWLLWSTTIVLSKLAALLISTSPKHMPSTLHGNIMHKILLYRWSQTFVGCVSFQTFCVPYFLLSKTVVFPAYECLCSGVDQQDGVLLQSSDVRVLAVVSGVGSSVRCWETPPTDPITLQCILLLWLKYWIWPPPYFGAWRRTLYWVLSGGKHALCIAISGETLL